jgi:hypothetical protein
LGKGFFAGFPFTLIDIMYHIVREQIQKSIHIAAIEGCIIAFYKVNAILLVHYHSKVM